MHSRVSLGIPLDPKGIRFNDTGDWLFEDPRRDDVPIEHDFADAAGVDGMD